MAEEHLQAILAQRHQVLVEAQVRQPQQLPQVQLGVRPGPLSTQALPRMPAPTAALPGARLPRKHACRLRGLCARTRSRCPAAEIGCTPVWARVSRFQTVLEAALLWTGRLPGLSHHTALFLRLPRPRRASRLPPAQPPSQRQDPASPRADSEQGGGISEPQGAHFWHVRSPLGDVAGGRDRGSLWQRSARAAAFRALRMPISCS